MALGAHLAESQDAVSQGLNNNLKFFQLLHLATESTSQESALSSELTEHCPRHVFLSPPSSHCLQTCLVLEIYYLKKRIYNNF